MFLKSADMQRAAAGQVIWVDESGLLGSQNMAALFDVAERIHARVILMGDRNQHSSPSRGTPLKLLEQEAGVPCVMVNEILRQAGDYKRAVQLLSDGKTTEGFDELDRLGWIQEVPDQERYLRLAEAYLAAASEKKPDGKLKTALVVTPTNAEAERITAVIRQALAKQGTLGEEHEFKAWVPLHLTEAERGEASSYDAGDLLQFHQHAKGYKSGQRLIVGEGPLPLDQAARFQVYRPTKLTLAAGDRLRVTANGKTADGRHRLNNGAMFTVKGFDAKGNIVADNGWVIAKDFGHISPGYVVTSWSSQSKTVDKVLIGESRLSFPASGRRGWYVEVSRGKEQTMIFTDNKRALREAVERDRERPNATEIFRPRKLPGRERLKRHLSFIRRWATAAWSRDKSGHERAPLQKEVALER